ncbi:MAG: hypothetical protein AAF664_25335, partial [Planctomycetota bacterium]
MKCEIYIELDTPDSVYRRGDVVSGKVHLKANQDLTCKGLQITSMMKTSGRGNVDSQTSDQITLYEGRFSKGQEEVYPFQLKVGQGPPSYHGQMINIDHWIEARVKLSFAFDPKTMIPITVRGAGDASEVPEHLLKGTSQWFAYVFIAIFASIFLFIAFALMVVAAAIPFLFWILLLVIGGGVGFWASRRWMIRQLLGQPKLELTENCIAAGDQLKGTLSVTPRKSFECNGITLTLVASEEATSGSGSNRKTHKHTCYEETFNLRSAGPMKAGDTQNI